MNATREIVEKIKDIISFNYKRRVYDGDVAKVLGMSSNKLAMRIMRDSIPYKHICEFCVKRNISINDILYNQRLGVHNVRRGF